MFFATLFVGNIKDPLSRPSDNTNLNCCIRRDRIGFLKQNLSTLTIHNLDFTLNWLQRIVYSKNLVVFPAPFAPSSPITPGLNATETLSTAILSE